MKAFFISVKTERQTNIFSLSRSAKEQLYGKFRYFGEAYAQCVALNRNKPDGHPGYIVEEFEEEERGEEEGILEDRNS